MNNINLVVPFKEGLLKVTKDQMTVDLLQENEFFFHEIIGCTIVSEEAETIGVVNDILQTGANAVWGVKGSKK
ncbi:PRC-barrel domain-containing protein, partial [Lysinibacillus sp. GbtcB16]|uniref:PRC-barrel domain-containing protein n=1 Tax=Lysinibacillus sp. GbtcB16 TaxID=2824761 RepID=UPI0020C69C09